MPEKLNIVPETADVPEADVDKPDWMKEWDKYADKLSQINALQNMLAYKTLEKAKRERVDQLVKELIVEGLEYDSPIELVMKYEQKRALVQAYLLNAKELEAMKEETNAILENFKRQERDVFPRRPINPEDYSLG